MFFVFLSLGTIILVSFRFIDKPLTLMLRYLGYICLFSLIVWKNGFEFVRFVLLIIIAGALAVYFLVTIITYFNIDDMNTTNKLFLNKNSLFIEERPSMCVRFVGLFVFLRIIGNSQLLVGISIVEFLGVKAKLGFFKILCYTCFVDYGFVMLILILRLFMILVGLNAIFKQI